MRGGHAILTTCVGEGAAWGQHGGAAALAPAAGERPDIALGRPPGDERGGLASEVRGRETTRRELHGELAESSARFTAPRGHGLSYEYDVDYVLTNICVSGTCPEILTFTYRLPPRTTCHGLGVAARGLGQTRVRCMPV